MEPTSPKMRLVFYTQIASIEERFAHLWKSGKGEDAVFEKASRGWFMHLKGSYEALYVGTEAPPGFMEGDLVSVTIDKVEAKDASGK